MTIVARARLAVRWGVLTASGMKEAKFRASSRLEKGGDYTNWLARGEGTRANASSSET